MAHASITLGGLSPGRPERRWLALFTSTRSVATVIAVTLLLAHRITSDDTLLAVGGGAYGLLSLLAALRLTRLPTLPVAWVLDGAIVLGFLVAAGQWRSPFYLLALTTLIFPATALAFRPALVYGASFTLVYLVIAVGLGIDWNTLETTSRLESFSTHLLVPMLVVVALAYAAQLLKRLETERERSERLAIQAERQRIAWELHDSAKQRIHAAHLILSSIGPQDDDADPLAQAMRELRSATSDMDTSLSDLRTPLLEGRQLAEALHERATELSAATDANIVVSGHAGPVPPFVAAHAYRIATEALTNAVRHSGARSIDVRIAQDERHLLILVEDDGCGLPANSGAGRSGLRSMHSRSQTIGATLDVCAGAQGLGTAVRLHVPLTAMEGVQDDPDPVRR